MRAAHHAESSHLAHGIGGTLSMHIVYIVCVPAETADWIDNPFGQIGAGCIDIGRLLAAASPGMAPAAPFHECLVYSSII